MTIALPNSNPLQFAGSGTAVTFSFPWKLSTASDLLVGFIVGGVYTLQSSSTYTVSGVGNNGGGQVTFTTAPANTVTVDLRPLTVQTQPTDFANLGPYLPENVTNAVDRLTREMQDLTRLAFTFSIHAADNESVPWTALPAPTVRANSGLIFDANGLPTIGVLLAQTLTQPVFNSFLSTSNFAALDNPLTAAETQAGVTPTNYAYPPGNALRYGADPTGLADSTTAIQNAINVAWLGRVQAYIPGGFYTISGTLTINAGSQIPIASEYRGDGFTLYGDGSGPAFSTSDQRTTVLVSSTNAPLLRYQQYLGSGTTSGNYYVRGIRFIQNSTVATRPVVQLDVLGEYSVFERCDVYQAGSGDGIQCLQLTKATIQYCNVLNRDWNTVGVGNGRVGTGINIFDQYNAGLGCVRKCTSRGFRDAYVLGYGSFDLGPFLLQDLEASVTYRGLTVGAQNSKTLVHHCYFEGQELTCITDNGRYTTIRENLLQPGTWTLGINASANGGGCVYDSNEVGLSQGISNVIGITVNCSATLMSTVTNNAVVWGSSGTGLANVIGIQLTGVDPVIECHGNMFNPNAGWTGTGTTTQLSDQTTATDGSNLSGVRGFGTGIDALTAFPRLERGAVSLHVNPTALGNGAMSGNTLVLGQASYYIVTFTSAQTISAFSGVSSGQVFKIHFTNGNPTLNSGANIKLAGSVSFNVGANGAMIEFLVEKGVAVEQSRTAF